MRALVVYESMFGNTRAVAEAVASGVSSKMPIELFDVASAPVLFPDDFDLLVLGGPTHAFGMSRESTRQSAIEQGAPRAKAGLGIREWLETASPGASLRFAATFDTRVDKPRVPGSAARKAARQLKKMGLTLVVAPESFFVDGVAGPLLDGELDRARRWGEALTGVVAPLESV